MRNPNLEDLDVRGNGLDGKCGSILATVLNGHSAIRTFSGVPLRDIRQGSISEICAQTHQRNEQFSWGPAEMVLLGSFLLDGHALVKLDLTGTTVGAEAFQIFGFAFRTQSNLTYLNLSRTGMCSEHFAVMVPGLRGCSSLRELHMGTNMLELNAMHSLSFIMKHALSNLRILDVKNNLIGRHGCIALSEAVLNGCLTNIDLSNNRVGAEGCLEFVRTLKEHHSLEGMINLGISFNGLDLDGARALCEVLPSMKSLKTLKIHSEIPVMDLRYKRDLMLTGMGFQDIEGVIVAHCIRQNKSMRTIDLRGNELGQNAFRDLSASLSSMNQLQKVNTEDVNQEMRWQDILKILRAGMNPLPNSMLKQPAVARRSTSPISCRNAGDAKISQTSSALSTSRGRKTRLADVNDISKAQRETVFALQEEKGESDDDYYWEHYKKWKDLDGSLRPTTAALFSDAEDSADEHAVESVGLPADLNRHLRFGWYGDNRNAKLRIDRCVNPRVAKKSTSLVGSKTESQFTEQKGIWGRRKAKMQPSFVEDQDATCGIQHNETTQIPALTDLVLFSGLTMPTTDTPDTQIRPKNAVSPLDVSETNISGLNKKKLRALDALEDDTCAGSTPIKSREPFVAERNRSPFSKSFRKRTRFKLRMMGKMGKISDPVGEVLKSNRICSHAGSRMGPQGAKKLAAELREVPARLFAVDLSLCSITGLDEDGIGEIDLEGFQALCRTLKRNNGITSLNLAWNRLTSASIPYLKTLLGANPTLITLDLYKNDLHAEGMKILSPYFEYLPRLRELNLRYNQIGPVGAATLADAFQYFTDLTTLDIAGNAFCSAGLLHLVPKMTQLRRLSSLTINENECGADGNRTLVPYIQMMSASLANLNGMVVEDFLSQMSRSNPKLPTEFENYESLWLAEKLQAIRDKNEDSNRFWMLYSHLASCLETIDFSWCNLTQFPESVLCFTCLKRLDVSHNLLQILPVARICALSSLVELNCEGNYQLVNPPVEISEIGAKDVMFYLREASAAAIEDDEVALIAVGGGSVGKSSCLSCLVTGLGRNVPKTRVIDSLNHEYADGTPLFHGEPLFDESLLSSVNGLVDSQFDLGIKDREFACLTGSEGTFVANTMYWRAADKLQFVVYDLPGHKQYCVTNRIFLRRRAVYLLVWRIHHYLSHEGLAKGMISVCDELTTWMDNVQALYPGCYCLAVATHQDVADTGSINQQTQIVYKAIKQKLQEMKEESDHGAIMTFFKDGQSSLINCNTGEGIVNLRKDLVMFTKSIKMFRVLQPKSFLQLRNCLRLIRNRHPLLDWNVYKDIAKLCGLEGGFLQVATRLLHSRGYLTFFDMSAQKAQKPQRKTLDHNMLIRGHLSMGHDLSKELKAEHSEADTVKEEPNHDQQLLSSIVLTSPDLLIRILRGLFVPDIELMIDWFSGNVTDSQDLSMLQATLRFQKDGIFERNLCYYLWPSSFRPQYKAFWDEYHQRGSGPLKAAEGPLCCSDGNFDLFLNVLHQFRVVARLTDTMFWIPCKHQLAHQINLVKEHTIVTDARAFKPFEQGICSEIQYSFLPPEFFHVLVSFCADIRDEWTKQPLDKIDYSPQVTALYKKGDSAQMIICQELHSCYYRLMIHVSDGSFSRQIHDKLHLAELSYPGIYRLENEKMDSSVDATEVPNILISYSLHGVPHAEIFVKELRSYDFGYKVKAERVSQYSKLVERLSISGRDELRKNNLKTISRLRDYGSVDGDMSLEKLKDKGFDESDGKIICDFLYKPKFRGQIIVVLLDELYGNEDECDWHPVCTNATGSFVILVLLPGCPIRQPPVKPLSVIDLRKSGNWIQADRELQMHDETLLQLKSSLAPLLQKLLSSWRGAPPSGHGLDHFDPPPVPCNECAMDGDRERQRFLYSYIEDRHDSFLEFQVRTKDFMQQEPPIYCNNDHCIQIEDALSAPTTMTASACPGCLEQGMALPHCFSRQACVDVLHGKKLYHSPDETLNHYSHHLVDPKQDSIRKNSVMQRDLILACPHCKRCDLDLVDILHAEAFVSYCKKKIRCTKCGKTHIGQPPELISKVEKQEHARHREKLPKDIAQHQIHKNTPFVPSFPLMSPRSAGQTGSTDIAGAAWTRPVDGNRESGKDGADRTADESAHLFFCNDCHFRFCQDHIDANAANVQRVLIYLEEHLDILSVKSSTIYDLKETTAAGGKLALKCCKSAKIFLMFLDGHYLKSHACIAEFDAAVQASRHIVPVLLPGYSSGTSNWYPADIKYKRHDGIHIVAPFPLLKHFDPITADKDENGNIDFGKLASDLLKRVSRVLYGGAMEQLRTRQIYFDWKQPLSQARSTLLGKWGKLNHEETDRKIVKMWKKHNQSLGHLKVLRHHLKGAEIKVSESEITAAMSEVGTTIKGLCLLPEWRAFMWNLISNSIMKIDHMAATKA